MRSEVSAAFAHLIQFFHISQHREARTVAHTCLLALAYAAEFLMLIQALATLGRGRRVFRTGLTSMISKRGPRNFYKGKGVSSVGKHTNKGEALEKHVCVMAHAMADDALGI